MASSNELIPMSRPALRRRLLAERSAFSNGPDFAPAQENLAAHLVAAIAALEPQCLGLYWPVRGEFNAIEGVCRTGIRKSIRLALPFVRKLPPRMEYRAWDGLPPGRNDEAGIASPEGVAVEPDVVLVPCLGFTDEGFRLGYGGGYFDRWLAEHPHVTTIGVAWSMSRMTDRQFQPESHDLPLTLIVTQQGGQ